MLFDGLSRVVRAGWIETTVTANQQTQTALVNIDESD
jgi:hypothetical protein